MDTNVWMSLLGLGLLVGVCAGGWAAMRLLRMGHQRDLQRVTKGLDQRMSDLAEQLRTANARSQTELEQLRQAHARQIQAVAAEPQAAVARAEQRLLAAYEELDRMRHQLVGAHAPTEPAPLGDGFAPTQPMPRGL